MMSPTDLRVGYLLKMYPRFSETFIVNEILAHEAAGLPVEIFSLRVPTEGRFHESYAHIQAPVTYVPANEPKAAQFWAELRQAMRDFPAMSEILHDEISCEVGELHQALWLARQVRSRGITLLHAHFGTTATTVARLVSRLTGLPYLFTAHAKDIFHESVSPADLRAKLSDAAAVITVSEYNAHYLRQHYGEAAARVQRIYNGLHLHKFRYQSPVDRPARIVAVGRLVEKKGFADLVDACAILVARGCDFTCDIVGDGPLQAPLQSQIEQRGLTDRVRLLGGQPQEEVIRQVQRAAVFAAPCVVGEDGNRDGLPTVLLEAMALGTPCVSTDVTGIPEVLHPGRTGLLVTQHDPQGLALALEQLLGDPALRAQLAATARAQIEANFDIERNTATIRELYQAATTQRTQPDRMAPAHASAYVQEMAA
jgi:colanic acid/amylovoran biosynthesis glycosyltransferase